MSFHRLSACLLTMVILGFSGTGQRSACAQQQPNTNPAYHQLRTLLPGSVTIPVENLTLKRDAGVFTFTRGDFSFYGEVNGKITGAVFGGIGHFHLTAPTAVERHNLEILTKKPEYDEDFSQAVLRFTDDTASEIKKGGKESRENQSDKSLIQAAMEFHTYQREHLRENLDLRLLQDVLSPSPGAFFLAAMKGSVNPHLLFEVDPHGASMVAPEEVRLMILNAWGPTIPSAFHLAHEYTDGTASGRQQNGTLRVPSEELDTSIEKSGFLSGLATVHLVALEDGVAVAQFGLFPSLRVSKAEGEHGEVLDFVQEKKEEDADFGLVLAHPLKKGEAATVRITYGGKDAVRNVGSDNYDPVARETWFPNGGTGFGSYSTYKMTFHTPKETTLIATGTKLSDAVTEKVRTTEWETGMPLPVAGFHLGRFNQKDTKTPSGLQVTAYGNAEIPDWAQSILRSVSNNLPTGSGPEASHMEGAALGSLGTSGMLPAILSQGTVAAEIYEGYFGKLSFDHLALSQQPACNYGQSWPMLVYLPICGLWDQTVQNQLGLDPADPYWKTVTAHEVAHQWWGHTVGFESYRDQWMSEGFADASAAIFLQSTSKTPKEFREFWRQLKERLTERNTDGFRPIDVGPVTLGFRLSSPKTGWGVYQNLVYPKGAYILHMLRMMMWTQQNGDADFRAMMHDFVDTYRLKVATTEDFKAMVEKHITPAMDLDGNHRMDWFFSEYVYGTELPHYHFDAQLTATGDAVSMHYKLEQSGVSDKFKMRVPIYVELADGRVIELGKVLMVGSRTDEATINLPKAPSPIKRVLIDYMHDVLAVEN